eukprot:g7563.t1
MIIKTTMAAVDANTNATLVRILAALECTHSPQTPPAERRNAQQFLIELDADPNTEQFAFHLLQRAKTQQNATVQHFGFQLLQKAIKARYTKWQPVQQQAVNNFLLQVLVENRVVLRPGAAGAGAAAALAAATPKFVVLKYAACLVEVAKRQEWPELWPVLGSQPDRLPLCVLVLKLLAEAIGDGVTPTKDLPVKRKKELQKSLYEKGDAMLTALIGANAQNGGLSEVEKIGFVRAFTPVLGLAYLLGKGIDDAMVRLIQKHRGADAGQNASDGQKMLREEVLLCLAEWSVTPLYPKQSGAGNAANNRAGALQVVQKPDVVRLCQNLYALCEGIGNDVKREMSSASSGNCGATFAEEDLLAEHRQIVAIVKDLVMTNAESLHREFYNQDTPPHQNPLALLWKGLLLQCCRYPSYFVASEALLALKTMAKPWKALEHASSFLNLDELVEVCLLRMWRPPEQLLSLSASSAGQTAIAKQQQQQSQQNLIHPVIQQVLQRNGYGSCWLEVLGRSLVLERDLYDNSANSEYGLLKNCVYLFLQTLAEVGGEHFFVSLVGKIRQLIAGVLGLGASSGANEAGAAGNTTAAKVDVLPVYLLVSALEASLGFLTRLTPYLVAKMAKEVKQSKKHGEQQEQEQKKNKPLKSRSAFVPTYPNLLNDPSKCVDEVLQLINELVSYDFSKEMSPFSTAGGAMAGSGTAVGSSTSSSSTSASEHPPWLRLEGVRLDFVGQVSTIYPVRPHVVLPIFDYLFQRVEVQLTTAGASAEANELLTIELHRKALNCLTTICKNGQRAVLVHLDALIAKAEKVHGGLNKNNQQLLMQSLVAAASSDFFKQRQIVELASRRALADWTDGEGKVVAMCLNRNNALVAALQPMRAEFSNLGVAGGGSGGAQQAGYMLKHASMIHKQQYYADAKLLSGTLQAFLMILKHTSSQTSPYILREGATAPLSEGSEQQGGSSSSSAQQQAPAPAGDLYVERPNAAAGLVREITPNLFQLLKTFFACLPSDWLTSDTCFVDQPEWLMIMGNEKICTQGGGGSTGNPDSLTAGARAGSNRRNSQDFSSTAGASASPASSDEPWRACYANKKTASLHVPSMATARDDFDREAGIWTFNLRFTAMRTLAAVCEAADGFWQLPHVVDDLIGFITECFPKMSPNHVELFYKHVFPSIFSDRAPKEGGGGGSTKQKTLTNDLCEALCDSELLPVLLRETVAVFEKYWKALDPNGSGAAFAGTTAGPTTQRQNVNAAASLLHSYPLFEPVAVTALLSLGRTVATCWNRLVVCGFGGSHSSVFVEYSTRVEARPFAWVDFLFRKKENAVLLLEAILFLMKIPDPESQGKFGAVLRVFVVQTWSTGCLHNALHRKTTANSGSRTWTKPSDLLRQHGTPTFGANAGTPLGTPLSGGGLGLGAAPSPTTLTAQAGSASATANLHYSGGNAEELLPLPDFLKESGSWLDATVPQIVRTALLLLKQPLPTFSEATNMAIEKRFAVYRSEQEMNGKRQKSPFVCNLSHVLFTCLQLMDREYALQCKCVNANPEHLEENLNKFSNASLRETARMLSEALPDGGQGALAVLKAVMAQEVRNEAAEEKGFEPSKMKSLDPGILAQFELDVTEQRKALVRDRMCDACSCQCCTTVESGSLGIVTTWGKFQRVAPPGLLCFPFPCMCQLAGTVSTRQQSVSLQCETKTKDNVFVNIGLEVQYVADKVEAEAAFYRLTNVEKQIASYVQDEVRSVMCTRLLDEAYNDRDVLISSIRARLTEVMRKYGYALVAVLVQDIVPARKVFQSMNAIESLRRLKQATINAAEAEKNMIIKRAEGESERKRLLGVGMGRQRVALLRGMEMSVHKFVETDAADLEKAFEKVEKARAAQDAPDGELLQGAAEVDDPAATSLGENKGAGKGGGAIGNTSTSEDRRAGFGRRATMELRVEQRDAIVADILQADANRLRMPTDVGVEDTNSLFPPEALIETNLIELDASRKLSINARDVMELLLILNYFDMLKEVGTNDSASTIYMGHNPAAIRSMRDEIHKHFSGGSSHDV